MLKCPYREHRSSAGNVSFPNCLENDCPWYAEWNKHDGSSVPVCERTHYDFTIATNKKLELEQKRRERF